MGPEATGSEPDSARVGDPDCPAKSQESGRTDTAVITPSSGWAGQCCQGTGKKPLVPN